MTDFPTDQEIEAIERREADFEDARRDHDDYVYDPSDDDRFEPEYCTEDCEDEIDPDTGECECGVWGFDNF